TRGRSGIGHLQASRTWPGTHAYHPRATVARTGTVWGKLRDTAAHELRSRGLLPRAVVNTVIHEQPPCLEVQQRSGHPHHGHDSAFSTSCACTVPVGQARNGTSTSTVNVEAVLPRSTMNRTLLMSMTGCRLINASISSRKTDSRSV